MAGNEINSALGLFPSMNGGKKKISPAAGWLYFH